MQAIPHDSSGPGDPQASGMAERHVQEVKYGTAAALGQAGLPHRYWNYAMYYFETAWNISLHRGSDKSPYELRHGYPCLAQVMPFGARVKFIPAKASRLWLEKKPFAGRTVEGIFFGWVLKAGARWSNEYWVAPISAFEKVSLKDGDGGNAVRPQRTSSLWTTGGRWALGIPATAPVPL